MGTILVKKMDGRESHAERKIHARTHTHTHTHRERERGGETQRERKEKERQRETMLRQGPLNLGRFRVISSIVRGVG
jgi:hypothetical protein